MKETLDNYEEFIEKTILEPISREQFFESFDNLDSYLTWYPSIECLKNALWEAFKAGRNYQFKLGQQ